MIRQPAVAGQFYYFDNEMLDKQVRELVNTDLPRKHVKGIVSPHAGLMYSGKVAGEVYSRIKTPDTFILLGPNHSGFGPDFSIMTEGLWKMPFGDVRIDSLVAKEIYKSTDLIDDDMQAHSREHSLEVQLPFMQYFGDGFQIIPIAIKHYTPSNDFLELCMELGSTIANVLNKLDMKFTIVASTDFTHYESQEKAMENDQAAIDAILNLDPKTLFKVVKNRSISMCGYAPVAIMLSACLNMGATSAELVKYMTSGDIVNDYSQVVGYGGLIVD